MLFKSIIIDIIMFTVVVRQGDTHIKYLSINVQLVKLLLFTFDNRRIVLNIWSGL